MTKMFAIQGRTRGADHYDIVCVSHDRAALEQFIADSTLIKPHGGFRYNAKTGLRFFREVTVVPYDQPPTLEEFCKR